MLFPNYVSYVSRVFAENRLMKFVIVVLVCLLVYSQVKIIEFSENTRTVIVPSGLTDMVSVSNSTADEAYLNAMGVYIATLLYSTTPVTVENQYSMLMKLFDTDAYNAFNNALFSAAATHKKNEVTQILKIDKITVEYAPHTRLIIDTSVERYIYSNKSETGTSRHQLIVDFEIRHGRFYITDFKEQK